MNYMTRRPLLIGSLAGAAACVLGETRPASAAAVPPRLKELLREFRRIPGLVATFEEEKNISLLAAPLRSSGKVYFHPPHSLARIMEKPRESHLVINNKRIVVKEGGQRREVDLSDKPALRGLISSLLHVLSGNEKKLVQDFDIHFSVSGASSWSLQLMPKEPALKRMVVLFHFEGTGLVLSRLRVKEANGDETLTRFLSVKTDKKFSKDEIEKIFEI